MPLVSDMNKRIRQYVGLLSALLSYYFIHEGAHLIYALCVGAFKKIIVMGLGVQIDVYADKMTETELGFFCLVGSLATLAAACLMVLFADKITQVPSKLFKACAYYITIAMLFVDPLYLSFLCGFFGGGDMNGISLLVPEIAARIVFGVIFVINLLIFIKIILPKYKTAFKG